MRQNLKETKSPKPTHVPNYT